MIDGLPSSASRTGGDEGFFGFGGDDLDMNVVCAGEEEALPDWEVREAFLFFVGELEDVGQNVDGGGGLFQEKLHGRVRDDSATHLATHEVFDVLGDGG